MRSGRGCGSGAAAAQSYRPLLARSAAKGGKSQAGHHQAHCTQTASCCTGTAAALLCLRIMRRVPGVKGAAPFQATSHRRPSCCGTSHRSVVLNRIWRCRSPHVPCLCQGHHQAGFQGSCHVLLQSFQLSWSGTCSKSCQGLHIKSWMKVVMIMQHNSLIVNA